ncbi:sulfite exporter TauE/SafE family protein [Sphingomicrobium sp. XHP0235]|uniref:sulfite exporter TauE/SafE family protein n=1 Tax=Sphingomicrobium aquimarinum TaxID=3133971 RepID=UPI0031FF0E58
MVAAFFLTAFLYSGVGFGGGSTYTALLVLSGLSLRLVPLVALACNIIVVAVGASRFASVGAFSWRRFWPLALLSIPAAWLGGSLMLPEGVFIAVLAIVLFLAGLVMIFGAPKREARGRDHPRAYDVASGAGLGFVAGVTGIGGGIYLSPLLHLRGWGSARLIAGTCGMFILVNSLAGLAGQSMKFGTSLFVTTLLSVWPLALAVLLGGALGSWVGATRLSSRWLRILSAILILAVSVRLGLRVPAIWSQSGG